MRLAFLSDIHGNTISLEAVLADIENCGGVDGYMFVGDYCALGFNPVGVLERITQLPNAKFTRGNTDRYITSTDFPTPTLADAFGNERLTTIYGDVRTSFGWTQGSITQAGWYDWVANLPLEERLTLPDGTRLLAVHAAPNEDDGLGFRRDYTDDDFRVVLDGCHADLVLTGHTHIPLDRTIDAIRAVNIGALSNPHMPDLRASYVILDADENGYSIEQRYVDYDRQAVINELERVHHPAANYITAMLTGRVISTIFR